MWLSEKLRGNRRAGEISADLGVTTIGGGETGVYARGETREVRVCTPGGVCWQPRSGDQVLVLNGGPGGEAAFVLGVQRTKAAQIAAGDLYLSSGGASICLRNDGAIELSGRLVINGEAYAPCHCSSVSGETS